ncbi:hypothetical protein [Flavobacterium selenitireducens]|uniref:hypothetical protein n=1 Tax=Flavobacterium selenitireducens TaxID=2722704 RepID=UPI00168BD945|nr:hypothetical protein [Flavobacterium selenitireducens]MBD3584050.1 hypothetical protein [Flavobacterium selenitireducens]
MKNIFNVLFILSFYSGFTQKYVDAKIITLDNDTINSRIKIATNIFDKKLIDEASFFRTLVLIDDNGNKTQKIKAANVRELTFIDFNQKNMLYVNNGKALKKVMYNGTKIKWYWDISQNLYDGSIQYSEYLIDDKGTKYKIGLFKRRKSTLLELTKSKPELVSEIENIELTNDNMLLVLKKYETPE